MSSSIIYTYADLFDVPRQEALDWVRSYIKRPGEFPQLIEAGLMEDTEEGRKESIQGYIKRQIELERPGLLMVGES